MPCYDKKLEASRSDFYSEVYQVRDVDCVLTTGELDLLLQERDFDPFRAVAGEDDTSPKPTECPFPELLSHPGTSSGSYLHSIITALTNEAKNKTKLIEKRIRGSDDHIEYFLQDTVTGETLFKGAKCYGFRNLQNLVRKLGKETGVGNHASRTAGSNRLSAAVAARRKKAKTRSMAGSASTHTLDGSLDQSLDDERTLDYVEVMACPGGCVNGGGQMKPGSGNAATSIARRTDKDAEGYRRDWTLEGVATEIDEGMRWSTRSWVTKVEKNYWQEARSSKVGAHDESGLVDLVVDRVLSQLEPTVVELISTVGTNEGYAKPQQAEFLRTRYHRVESEFNALTAKW
jgi:iron only hydrogenase large subunit-like protein